MDWMEELGIEQLLQAAEIPLREAFPSLSIHQIIQQWMNGTFSLDGRSLLLWLQEYLWHAVTAQYTVLGQLIVLAVIVAVLKQWENSFSAGNLQKSSEFVIQAIAVLLVLQSGQQILQDGLRTVIRMGEWMQLFLPIQFLLMVALGNIKTAGLLQPSLLLFVQVAVWFFKTILYPLLVIEFLLKLVNTFSDRYQLEKLAALLRKFLLMGIGFSAMLLLAVVSIGGIGGHVMDGLSLRTAKYVTKLAVPVVGGVLSGLLETLLQGGTVVRNTVGGLGLCLVLLLTVVPALKFFLYYVLYSVFAAILQPLGDSKILLLLEQAAGSFLLLFAIITLTGICFFFMIWILLAASGAA